MEPKSQRLNRIVNSKYLLWLVLALPFASMTNAWRAGDLFYGEMIHASGDVSARLLILTLAITPLRLMFPHARWPVWLMRRRRYFGVAAFVYAMLHTVVYVDRKQDFALIVREGMDFSMWTGWLAFLMFIVLAITSNDASVRRLKRTWKKLHRWVYPAALLTFLHWIFAAFDFVPGLIHMLVLVFFESCRIWLQRKSNNHAH